MTKRNFANMLPSQQESEIYQTIAEIRTNLGGLGSTNSKLFYERLTPSQKRAEVHETLEEIRDALARVLIGKNAIFTSNTGAVGDSNRLVPGSGTDDTLVIQAALDTLEAAGVPGILYHDMFCKIDGLKIASHITLRCMSLDCGFNKSSTSVLPFLIRNKNPTRPTYSGVGAAATITDYNRSDTCIRIEGGTWVGNNLNLPRQIADNTWHVGIALFGVTKCKITGPYLENIRTFAIHLANCDDVMVDGGFNIDVETLPDGYAISNQDGVHVNGPFNNVRIIDGRIKCWDDAVAFNLDDGESDFIDPASPHFNELGPLIGRGDGTNSYAKNIFLDESLLGVRVLSKWSRAHNIVFDGFYGTVRNYFAALDKFRPVLDGPGNYGTIILRNWNVTGSTHVNGPIGYQFHIYCRGKFEQLILQDMVFNGQTEEKQIMTIAGDSDIDQLIVDGLTMHEKHPMSHGPTGYLFVVAGKVEQASFNNVRRFKDSASDQFGIFLVIADDGGSIANYGIGTLTINDYVANKSSHIVHRIDGRLDKVRIDNMHLTDYHPDSRVIANNFADFIDVEIGENYSGPLAFGGFAEEYVVFNGTLRGEGSPEAFVPANKGTRWIQTDAADGVASTWIMEASPSPSRTGWVQQTL